MNKTVVFVTFAVLAALAILGAIVLFLYRSEQISAYSGFIVNLLGLVTVAAGTFAVLGQQSKKVEKIEKQTNGTLSKLMEDSDTKTETIRILERENAELRASAKHSPRKASQR